VSTGVDVIDVGVVTTPMLYFAASTLCSSGIQVTGSHNPKDYNGFKMVLAGRAIYGDEIQACARRWKPKAGSRPAPPARSATSTSSRRTATASWRHQAGAADEDRGRLRQRRRRRLGPAIFRAIGCEVIELFSEVDGNFPNHHPDPSKPENLKDLIRQAEGPAAPSSAWPSTATATGWASSPRAATHLPGPPDDAVRPRRAHARARRHHPVRRQVHAAPGARHPRGRRQPLMYKTGHSLIKAKMKESARRWAAR
jgi:phosphomannomutase